jgi:peroxiredoxin
MGDLQKKLPALTLATDKELKASTTWGLHEAGAENPSPGTFVVDRAGTIKFRRLDEPDKGDWPTYDEVLAALR